MSAFTFAPASKAQAKARVALAGPSGSGKTYTGLTTATALAAGGRVALIDTERGSASKYADRFGFDTLQMHEYDPRNLIGALRAAGAAGYGVVVVDSLSHFWSGKGGMLEQADNAGKRYGGNTFAGWKEARPLERELIDALLAYPGHVIVTMRTKTEWVIEDNERGRKQPRKIGTKPEQRDGIEYEFDVVADLDVENTLIVSKSRCPALAKAVMREPGPEFGQALLDWLDDGEPVVPPPPPEPMSDTTRARMFALFGERGIDDPDRQRAGISRIIGRTIVSRGELTEGEAQAVIASLRGVQ